MRVALIEDEVPALEHLEALLTQARPDCEIVARLRTVRQTRAWLAESTCDLIVADIQLGDGSSLEVLGELSGGTPVVFITAHDTFMAEAFERNGIAYLLKPIEPSALQSALSRLAQLQSHFLGNLPSLLREWRAGRAAPQRLVGRRGVDWVGVELLDLRWVRVRHGVTTAATSEGSHVMLEETLQQLESRLASAGFFRANRWYLVSLPAVARVRPAGRGRLALTLAPDAEEPVEVTQQHAAAFRQWFGIP